MPNPRNAGRKPKLTSEEVIKIIYEFRSEFNVTGMIKYKDIFQFTVVKYNSGEIKNMAGEDFWRKEGRLGRELVDQANEVYKHKLIEKEGVVEPVINVVEIVLKYYDTKNELVEKLLPLERLILKGRERENVLNKKLSRVTNEMTKIKELKTNLKKQVDDYQDVLFNLFRYGMSKEVPLPDFLRMGSQQSKIVDNALIKIFDAPAEYIENLNLLSGIMNKEDNSKNVIKLSEKIMERYKD